MGGAVERADPYETGANGGRGGSNRVFCWRGLTLERRDGVFCGAVRTAGGRRGDS